MSDDADKSLTRLSDKQLAALLSKAGTEPITEATIKEQISRGAPVNEDGTIHFVRYAAWLAMRVS